MAKDEIIKLLKQYCLLLYSAGISIEKAFLFGSYAREEASDDSDIDIMIVSKDFDNNSPDSNIKAWSLTRKVDSRIEPYSVGLKQYYNDNVSPILQIVKQEGIELNIDDIKT